MMNWFCRQSYNFYFKHAGISLNKNSNLWGEKNEKSPAVWIVVNGCLQMRL